MHKRLEEYLGQVAARLGALPADRRDEELREMRAHLESAAEAYRELGASDEEAAESAARAFGAPDLVGKEIVGAWRSGEARENRRGFWAAAACTSAVIWLVGWPMSLLQGAYGPELPYWDLLLATLFVMTSSLLPVAAAGAIAGWAFPRQAVRGSVCGLTANYAFSLGTLLASGALTLHLFAPVIMNHVLFLVLSLGVTTLSAREGSRRRMLARVVK